MEKDEIRSVVLTVITSLLNGLKTKDEAKFATTLLLTGCKYITAHASLNLVDSIPVTKDERGRTP